MRDYTAVIIAMMFIALFLISCVGVEVKWEEVTTNTAGQTIEVDYYKIYYKAFNIEGDIETTETFSLFYLPAGYYEFSVSAVKDSLESEKSEKATITIREEDLD